MPTPDDLGKAYQRYYTHAAWSGNAQAGTNLPRGLRAVLRDGVATALLGPPEAYLRHRGVHAERARMRTMYLDDVKPGRLLDVGCGSGAQLVWLRDAGWRVEGQDVDPTAVASVRAAHSFTVHAGPLADLGLPPASYDAITLCHVLEHVHDPVGLLRTCVDLLVRGGVLVARTPNFQAFGLHEVFGRNWPGLEPPRHLYHYTAPNLAEIAQRAGLTEIKSWTTAANAEVMGDRALGLCGATGPSLGRALQAKYFQLRALARHARDPQSGEEIVMRACRPG